jgi:hypothetical protein
LNYVFENGQRVTDGCRFGEITGMVPGSGHPESEWYYVTWDDGFSNRYMRGDLTPA